MPSSNGPTVIHVLRSSLASLARLSCDLLAPAIGQEYSKALGRTITFQDIPVEPWRDALRQRGFPVHVVNHLAVMADLHRAGRFDRMSDEVLMLTRQRPLSVQEFVRNNAAAFTTQAPMMASA